MLDTLKDLICGFVECNRDEITENTDIRTDLDFNSFDLVNFAVAVEDQIGTHLSDSDLAACFTVGDIMKYLEK